MNKDDFIHQLQLLKIDVSSENLRKLELYKDLLKEYNDKFNLTAIIDDEGIYLKHFYDCLYLLTQTEIKNADNIIDIGTGAGFPGLLLAIFLNNTKFTLVESNGKKCMFLKTLKESLNLNNVNIINKRAEEYARETSIKYDVALSRAVSNLYVISELEIPFLKVGGLFMPLKSHIDEELAITNPKLKELNSKIVDIIEYELPYEKSKRTILKILKEKETDKKYPRDYAKITKDLKKLQK